MLVKAARKASHLQPVTTPEPQAQIYTFIAQSRGLTFSQNLATPTPGGATLMDNWFPTARGARVRGGTRRHAIVSTTGGTEALLAYNAGGASKLFACTEAAIYDVTNPASPTAIPTPAVTGQTSGDYASAMMSTAGGGFMMAVNGANPARLFNGATWSVASMTGGPGTNGNQFSHVWAFKNRLFFIQRNSLSAWFLPVLSIGGALAEFSLAGVFQRGGSLLFGASLSSDAGNSLNDVCLFVSDQGEVAVYQGSNPSDINDWSIVGRYDVGRPLGKNAFIRAGGDIAIATDDGLIPLTSAIKRDKSTLALDAVSAEIEPAWRIYAGTRRNRSWSIAKMPSRNVGIVIMPAEENDVPECLAVNLQTNAWSKFTGWNLYSCAELGGNLYLGTSDGRVLLAETGGTDDGVPYNANLIGLPENLGTMTVKTALMGRATFIHSTAFVAKLSIASNYRETLLSAPPATADNLTDVWDTGLWDVAVWDAGSTRQVQTEWVSTPEQGFTFAPVLQITSGTVNTPDIELVSIDLLFEPGGVLV